MYALQNIGAVINLDKSNTALLEQAKVLSEANNANIKLLIVTEDELSADQQAEIETKVSERVDFKHIVVYLTGKAVLEITRFCISYKIDMLLIEADEPSGFNKFFQGSLPLSLVRRAPCHVWIVKKPSNNLYEKVMVAVDSEEENAGEALNNRMIKLGATYATAIKAEYHLVSAWRLRGEYMLNGPFIRMSEDKIAEMRNECHVEHAHAFEVIQRRNAEYTSFANTALIYGQPATVIPQYVQEQGIDVLIIGSLTNTGVAGFLIGSNAESIINQVDCAIIAVKPEGFVCPVPL